MYLRYIYSSIQRAKYPALAILVFAFVVVAYSSHTLATWDDVFDALWVVCSRVLQSRASHTRRRSE